MEKFGKYVLVKLIAMGGMAEVFLAKEFGISGFQRILAIKRVLPHLAQDQEFIEMFTGEARLSAQLTHPNIVQIFDFGLTDDSYFLAMEYIDGLTMSDLLSRFAFKGEVLPVELALHVSTELCQGLDYAHNKRSLSNEPLNIVHRDISPKNAMLSFDGAVKLMDFGIAKATDQQRQETISGTIKGKISYLSPEQVMGSKLDRRSDIFSLGVVIWEMLTSRKCFSGDNEFAILYKIRMAEVAAPSTIRPGLSPELDAIVLKALRGEREERYQTAEELLNDLNAFRYKHGLLASTSKLAGFLREMKSGSEEDTLQSLQKIDWNQVEAQFGLSPTVSLRTEQDTPAAEAVAAVASRPVETPGRGIRKEGSAGDDSAPRAKKPPRPLGKDTSKKIAQKLETSAGQTGPGQRPAAEKARSTRKLRAPEPVGTIEEELESPGHEEEPATHLIPMLVAVSVLLLTGTVGFFAYFLWPQVSPPEPTATPTARPTALMEEETPIPATARPEVASPQATAGTGPSPRAIGTTPVVAATHAPVAPTVAPPSPRAQQTPAGKATAQRADTPIPAATAAATLAVPPTTRPTAPSVATAVPVEVSTPQRPRASVVIQASVPVELYVGGAALGRLSGQGLRVSLPPGTHQFVASGYLSSSLTFYRAEFSLTVGAGETRSHTVSFPALGTLNVTSGKPATLYVDGVRIDQTPIQRLNITSGPHELRFDFKSGESSRMRYSVRAGQYTTVFGKP